MTIRITSRVLRARRCSSPRLRCRPRRRRRTTAKTLRVVLPIAETSFDPAFASDAASDDVIACIMEAMLDYDYLARPVKLVPRTLEAMPVMEEGGKALHDEGEEGNLLHARPGLQGQAARTDRGRSRLRAEAHHGPGGAIAVAVDARGQDRRPRRRAREGEEDGQVRLRRAGGRASRSSTAIRSRFVSTLRTCAFSTSLPFPTPRRWRAKWSRPTATTSARILSAPGRTCSANTSAARASNCWPTRDSAR